MAVAALALVFGSGPARAADPTLTAFASPSGFPAGIAIFDFATLAGGDNPTGTITFDLFGPDNATCSGPPIFTSTVTVVGNGNYQSDSFPTNAAGTYRWVARYSGDANNTPAATACGDPLQATQVALRQPTFTTQASSVSPAGLITDTAQLGNGAGPAGPTGTITFDLFGPDNLVCGGPPIFTSNVTVAGNGTYVSEAFRPLVTGTYIWRAEYSGDVNNFPATTICADPAESVVVTTIVPPPSVTLITTASPSVPLGGQVTDTAVLSGGVNPTGTITFQLFGPDDPTCATPPILSNTKPVAGNAPVTSDPFAPVAPGVYRWVATYSGDANHVPVATACGDPAEAVTVTPPGAVTLTTTASPSVPVGGQVTDTATLSGGVNPTGTITFQLFGPDDPTCTTPPIFSNTKPVGAGSVSSDPFTANAPGVYRWVATYSGDANHGPVTTACTDPAESVVVTTIVPPPTVTLTTTASPSVPLGGQVTDTATLSGGVNPTGTITFRLFGPDDATCAGPAVFLNPQPVAGNGSVTSDPFTPTAAGVYRWTATYSGDANHAPVATACADPAEAVTVTPPGPVTPTLTTTASPSVPLGGQVTDTATLSGGVNPTGTVTFRLFGPNDATCTTTPIFTNPKAVTGNGSVTSDPFTPIAAGVYRWTATYSGDPDNAGVATACGDPTEQVTVTPTGPGVPEIQVDKTATPATLPEPGGTVTFGVVVTNTSAEPLTLIALVDDQHGALAGSGSCALGAVLTPGGTYPCSFTADVTGNAGFSETDTVQATARNAAGTEATASDSATVTITDALPVVVITHTVDPPSRTEQGGEFTHSITVSNTGFEQVTIATLTDSVYGNLITRPGSSCASAAGAVLEPGDTYSCSFTATFTGEGGATQTDVAAVTVVDDEGSSATASAPATITLVDVPPRVGVDLAITPESRPAPGGSFTFTVTVRNLSNPEAITIQSLTSDVHGDLDGRGDCRVGVILAAPPAAGDTFTCSFVAPFTGEAGARLAITISVVVADNEGTTASAASPPRTIVLTAPAPGDGTPGVPTGPRITDRPALLAFTGAGAGDESVARWAALLVVAGIGMSRTGRRRLGWASPGYRVYDPTAVSAGAALFGNVRAADVPVGAGQGGVVGMGLGGRAQKPCRRAGYRPTSNPQVSGES
ncbi:MAG: hypothetical protein ABR540_12275 [Acidimicrobiales bacterium]